MNNEFLKVFILGENHLYLSLDKYYGAIPNNLQKKEIISKVLEIIKKYWDTNDNIELCFTKWLFKKVCKENWLDTKNKKKKYFQALWYSDERVYEILHPYN